MNDLFDLPDEDLCQPDWLSEFARELFPELYLRYDEEFDFDDYIYPIEPDSIIRFFYKSCLSEILQATLATDIKNAEDYLRSIDLIQRNQLPFGHFDNLGYLVSFYNFLFISQFC